MSTPRHPVHPVIGTPPDDEPPPDPQAQALDAASGLPRSRPGEPPVPLRKLVRHVMAEALRRAADKLREGAGVLDGGEKK